MISDLLAQISGETDGAGKPPCSPQPPKRKASHELAREPISKAPRTIDASRPGSSYETKPRVIPPTATRERNGATPVSRPSAAQPGLRQTGTIPKSALSFSSASGRPSTGNGAARVADTAIKDVSRNGSMHSTNIRVGPKTATTTSAATTISASKPPKKGSFQEIMERAKANQANLAQLGKIQHKPLERLPTKRERMLEAKARGEKGGRMGKSITRKASSGARPLSKGGHSNGKPGDSGANDKTTVRRKSTALKKEEEKASRPKKAATATTGYQGTARPRHPIPSASASASSTAASKTGAGAASSVRRSFSDHHRRTSSWHEDDDDDDLDDFIEYDDDDAEAAAELNRLPGAGRWRYAASSEDDEMEEEESDMEAGMSDIDEEERRAERQARLEDAEQEALERRHKMQKEARRQQLLARTGK